MQDFKSIPTAKREGCAVHWSLRFPFCLSSTIWVQVQGRVFAMATTNSSKEHFDENLKGPRCMYWSSGLALVRDLDSSRVAISFITWMSHRCRCHRRPGLIYASSRPSFQPVYLVVSSFVSVSAPSASSVLGSLPSIWRLERWPESKRAVKESRLGVPEGFFATISRIMPSTSLSATPSKSEEILWMSLSAIEREKCVEMHNV